MIHALRGGLVLLMTGCTFQPGVSFGSVSEATLAVGFQPPIARLDETGRIKTDTGYRVRIDSLRLIPTKLDFQSTSGSAGSGATFDPANPPEGYSLCHNGHCHRDDGALIDYEDIRAELSGGTLKTMTILSLPVTETFELTRGTATASITQCQPSCQLDQGSWSKTLLNLASLEATGSVEDGTSANRLSGQAREWSLTLSPEAFSQKVAVSIDRNQGERLTISASFTLTEKLWDQLDFQTLAATPGTLVLASHSLSRERLVENLAGSRFNVSVTR